MPRRDVGNEFIVALAAVGTLALALAFGAILTISRTVAVTPSATAIAGGATTTIPATPRAAPSATVESLASSTAVPSTAAPSTTAPVSTTSVVATTRSVTPRVLSTTAAMLPTLSATARTVGQAVSESVRPTSANATGLATQEVAISASFTPTPRPTPTPSFTLTVAPTVTASWTASDTATLTPSPSPTFTATDTETPTDTPTVTPTDTPTDTATFTPTTTPTDTPTDTPTGTPTDTPIDTPTDTPTDIPTDTPTLGPTYVIVTVTPAACTPRDGWVPYIVQPGDTLFRLSLRAGISVSQLQKANCLFDTTIYYGQVLVVPPGSAVTTPATGGPASITGCSNPAQTITLPAPGAAVQGTMVVTGTANIPNFSFYKLEVRADNLAVWHNFKQTTVPVNNGVLGTLNTDQFVPGLYWIQLVVVDKTGNFPLTPCALQVRFGH
ncbi:MAG TPA: LysM peptidoglycan-binding domain-containing protein [Aggregatilineales bacterium]|nr:LysM peptidoglycan-binding domain-containing protein [Aggregatilineales bacterium]